MASTTQDDGFHEIQLNGKQLVFLFMAVTVVSVVIFLCGVLVGRSARTDAVAAVTVTEGLPDSAPVPAAPPAPAVETSGSPSANSSETLTYPKRLASGAPEREQLSPPSQPAATPAPKSAPPAPAPVAKPAAPATSASSATPTGQPAVPREPAGPGFAIQLAALGRREEADGIARRLTGKGYSAYVVSPDAGAPSVFRVRVGKFKDRREAESVAARLKQEEQFNPWIVR